MRHDLARYLNECSCTIAMQSGKDGAWKSPLCRRGYGLFLLLATLSFYSIIALVSRFAAKIIIAERLLCQDHSNAHFHQRVLILRTRKG